LLFGINLLTRRDKQEEAAMKDPTPDERNDPQRMDEGLRQRLEGMIPEIVRRTFYAGLGAVFTTEEEVRKLASEFSLPKDVARFLVQQAQGTKNEILRIVGAELRRFLESLNLNDELQRLLTSLHFEIKTEIRLIPNDQNKLKSKVKNTVVVRRDEEEVPEGGEDAGGEGPGEETVEER
jgi:hypothetical protein